MPPIRSTASERYACVIAVILLLNKIMPTCSCYVLKGLVYIIITVLSNCQPSSCFKCIKSNMCLSYNIKSVSTAECMYFMRPCTL